ncbi:MAG: FliH/SctL family protein [Acidimicrobiales bacterium]
MTMQRFAGSDVAAPSGPRISEGHGLTVRRDPLDPGRPIGYDRLFPGALDDGIPPDGGYAAGYEAGYADGQRAAETEARETERRSTARVDTAVSALCRAAHAARLAYEERSGILERAVPQFAFALLEELFGRESVLAVDPGRDAIARALALDDGMLPAVARLSPGDAAVVGDLADLAPSRQVTVVADPTVEPGGALVEIGSTTIDSQLAHALRRVRAVLVGQPAEDRR